MQSECSSSFKYNNTKWWAFIEQWNWTVERRKLCVSSSSSVNHHFFFIFSRTQLWVDNTCADNRQHTVRQYHIAVTFDGAAIILFFFHHHHNYQQQVGVNLRRHTTAHHRHNLTLSLSLSLSRTAATTTAAIATCTSKQRQKQAVQHSTDYPTKALQGEKKHRRKRSRKNPI